MELKFVKGLLAGTSLTLTIGFTVLSLYTYNLYKTAEPAFRVKKTREYSVLEKKEITNALVKLSGITDFFGIDKISIVFTSSAAIILGDKSPLLAKFHFSRAIEIAERLASQTKNFDPLLEIRFNYSLFLKDIGAEKEALNYMEDTLKIGLKNTPNSYWIKNIIRANDALNKKS